MGKAILKLKGVQINLAANKVRRQGSFFWYMISKYITACVLTKYLKTVLVQTHVIILVYN